MNGNDGGNKRQRLGAIQHVNVLADAGIESAINFNIQQPLSIARGTYLVN